MEYRGITGKHSKIISSVFFVVGILGAVGLRFVHIAHHFSATVAKISWYVALCSFLIFYCYRMVIEDKRRRLLTSNNLKQKLESDHLKQEDKKTLLLVVDSLLVSKLKFNFIILFILTVLALLVGIVLDLRLIQ